MYYAQKEMTYNHTNTLTLDIIVQTEASVSVNTCMNKYHQTIQIQQSVKKNPTHKTKKKGLKYGKHFISVEKKHTHTKTEDEKEREKNRLKKAYG